MQDFKGQTALVTGAGSGIGQRIAVDLAGRGAYVVIAGRQLDTLRSTGESISKAGGQFLAVATDIRNEDSVMKLMDTVASATGRLDIAINAAGVFRSGALDEMTLDDFEMTFSTNTLGTWLCLKQEIQIMKRLSSKGVIVNIASNIGSHMVRAGTGAYAASKAAVAILTKTAALEAISDGIRINSISPGPADTTMSYRAGENIAQRNLRIAATNPSKRVATLAEISLAAIWLCSPDSSYMVGHDMVVDGGASL
ncbi:SDR family oxidoreductase [Diaphorobacter sp. HDW4A]|nr:SDR family oxidoreductase [Diaphorobacter sp. HDW4A]